MTIFFREPAGWQAWLAGLNVALVPKHRRLVPCQLDSLQALDRLGVRLDTYATINVPIVLLGGGSKHNPAHLSARLDAIQLVLPHARRVVMPKGDHGADLKAPHEVARIIERSPMKRCTDSQRSPSSVGLVPVVGQLVPSSPTGMGSSSWCGRRKAIATGSSRLV
jgi:hypothetical protein